MLSLYEILKASKTGVAPDMWTRLAAEKMAGSGGKVRELTGIPPLTFTANGQPLLDYTIYGNMEQSSTPAPDAPITPSECGERTGNLFDISKVVPNVNVTNQGDSLKITTPSTTTGVAAESPYTLQTYCPNLQVGDVATLSFVSTGSSKYIYLQGENITWVSGQSKTITSTMLSSAVLWYASGVSTEAIISNVMLNLGSTPLPYEPHGYKIPISSANTTTPVYLGEVETTRRVKKLVLTGGEIWGRTDGCFRMSLPDSSNTDGRIISTHFEYIGAWSLINKATIGCCVSATYYGSSYKYLMIRCDEIATTTSDFKSYLAAQYAAGTPVTVWYVLETEETGIVNEPLRKIGDYADTVSYEQAGVSISTLNGQTVVDVDTTLKPSEMYIKYKG